MTTALRPDALRRRVNRETALREIARCFLSGAGMTVPGELARVRAEQKRRALTLAARARYNRRFT